MAEPSPFSSAAKYYKHRAPYAPAAFASISSNFKLDREARVLDLGCGPGTVAIPLAHIVGSVVAVDPSAEMLEEGRSLAAAAGCRNIEWFRMPAESVTEDFGKFRLVTMGQSFHWMDRDRVLRILAELVEPSGGLALINPGRRRPQESWETVVDEIVVRHLGRRDRHPGMSPERGHEAALRRSACFSVFTAQEFAVEIERDVASILGNVYSMSTSPKPAFGARVESFEREVAEELLKMNPTGVFKERVETEVLTAVVNPR